MVKVKFTITGNRRYYGTTNGVTWYPLEADQATELVDQGIPLELS